MFRGRFLTTTLVTLLVLGLLAAAGFGLVRLGWSQGYAAGLLAEGAELPQPYYGPRFWGPALFGGPLALLCGIGLFFFLGMIMLRFLFFGRHLRAWKRADGPPPEGWPEHWIGWHHGPHGPWHKHPPGPETDETATAQAGDEPPIVAA